MTNPVALHLEFAGVTDVGKVRARNEDSFDIRREARLALVCDGMGGHAGGDIASRTAVAAIVEFVSSAGAVGPGQSVATIRDAVASANQRLVSLNQQRGFPEGRGMGTTVVGLWLPAIGGSDMAVIFHAGDSRLYRLRAGVLRQLTRDHSLYQLWLDGGGQGQAPHRNIIVRALGTMTDVEPEVAVQPVLAGDLFLLCSDGLTSMADDDEITAILRQTDDLEVATRSLVDLANGKGGHDNVTVVLVRGVSAKGR